MCLLLRFRVVAVFTIRSQVPSKEAFTHQLNEVEKAEAARRQKALARSASDGGLTGNGAGNDAGNGAGVTTPPVAVKRPALCGECGCLLFKFQHVLELMLHPEPQYRHNVADLGVVRVCVNVCGRV